MPRNRAKRQKSLVERFPPSPPCTCEVCLGYCARPGWWTVEEAGRAIQAGYAGRMMLEMSPDLSFGVLSPAFNGCEGAFATNEFSQRGCNFFKEQRCELYSSGLMPLECRFCHHERRGQGDDCHAALEQDWKSPAGQALVQQWMRITGFWNRWNNLRVIQRIKD